MISQLIRNNSELFLKSGSCHNPHTSPKFNMEPEKKSSENEVLLDTIIFRFHVQFRGSIYVFGGTFPVVFLAFGEVFVK